MLITIYQVMGLSSIESPWIAVIPIFILLAAVLLLCAKTFLITKQIYARRPVLRWVTTVLNQIVMLSAVLIALGITSVVRVGAGVQYDDPFSLYHTALFIFSTVPS